MPHKNGFAKPTELTGNFTLKRKYTVKGSKGGRAKTPEKISDFLGKYLKLYLFAVIGLYHPISG
jgi:hypothetical protein